MNRLSRLCFLLLTSTFGVLALSGCADTTSFPDASTNPTAPETSSPPIEGSVFGGHAPLVGARVYVLTPSRTANYGLVTSLMNTSLSTTAGASPVTPDVSGTGSPTNGMYYVTTSGVGGFALTGNYSCTAGYPVYLAAVGGSPLNNLLPGNSYPITSGLVNSVSTGSPVTESVTLTTTAPLGVYTPGEQVIFTGASGTLGALSGLSAVVQTAVTSGGTTKLTFTVANVGGAAGTTYAFTAPYPVALGISTSNTAVVNMAALGTCPSSGNFSTTGTGTYATGDTGAIPFIYMNEVSTAALAYGLAAFGKDAFHIGANLGGTNSTYVANSLNQAIFNAFLLYDITGSNVNNTSQGEGHLARSLTPEGNGIVPQKELDTLGNILAACVDSGETSTVTTAQCNTLEATATSDGTTTGTHAPDTATAIFNIAHYPGGVANSSFASTLFNIPTAIVPFSPALTSAPNDFSVTLAFGVPATSPTTGGTGTIVSGAQVIAIDGAEPEGIWVGNYYGQPVKIFQSGTPDYTTNAAMSTFASNQRSVTIDPSNNVWMTFGDANTVFKISNTGAVGPNFIGSGTSPHSDALNYPIGVSFRYNALANQYDALISNYSGKYLVELSPTLVNIPPVGGTATTPFSSAPCLTTHNGTNAVDPNGVIYSLGDGGTGTASLCVIDGATGLQDFLVPGYSTNVGPNYFAIGPALNNPVGGWAAWATDSLNNRLQEYAISGANSTFATLTGGGMNSPCSVAVDSAGTVWVGNQNNSSLSAFSYNSTTGAYYALSPTTAFAAQGGYTNCANPAVDRAGDVWITYQGTAAPTLGTIYETIGIASPTFTPLSTSTKGGLLGTRPY